MPRAFPKDALHRRACTAAAVLLFLIPAAPILLVLIFVRNAPQDLIQGGLAIASFALVAASIVKPFFERALARLRFDRIAPDQAAARALLAELGARRNGFLPVTRQRLANGDVALVAHVFANKGKIHAFWGYSGNEASLEPVGDRDFTPEEAFLVASALSKGRGLWALSETVAFAANIGPEFEIRPGHEVLARKRAFAEAFPGREAEIAAESPPSP